jgi:uncharacterized membrane protein
MTMPKGKERFLFVDLLRGWALLVMIEVHVFNVLLQPVLKTALWFNVLNFVNGLVAPSFLFISGFAFAISTKGKTDILRRCDYSFWKKLGRILLIILAGYSLHLPILSLRRLMHFYSRETLISFYNVDILQCIGIGLLFLFLLKLVIRSEKIYNIIIIISLLFSVLLSPIIWQTDFTVYMNIPLANYFNTMNGSFFPIFPWIGFILAGVVGCRYYLEARNNNKEKDSVFVLIILGLVLSIIGHIFIPPSLNIFTCDHKADPFFFLQRLGYIFFLLGVCWFYVEKRQTKTSFVLDVGRESLIVYWLHLQLLYRRFFNEISFASIYGDKFNIWGCIIVTVILAVLMITVAKMWGNFKRNYRLVASDISIGIVSLTIIIFLIGF